MEKVASIIDQQIGSVHTHNDGLDMEEGPSQRLLHSPSVDSMVGLRTPASPRSLTLDPQECWQPPEVPFSHPSSPTEAGSSELATSPFAAAAAQRPLEETIVVTPQRIYHGLTRPGNPRYAPAMNGPNKPEAIDRWKSQRTLLILWLVTAIVTLISSLRWLQLGVWIGILGIIGASFSLGCCQGNLQLSAKVQATRIFAVATSALSIFGTALFAFLLCRLPCPKTRLTADFCMKYRLALAMTTIWHAFHAGVAALVAARASQVMAVVEPLASTRIIVLQPTRSMPA